MTLGRQFQLCLTLLIGELELGHVIRQVLSDWPTGRWEEPAGASLPLSLSPGSFQPGTSGRPCGVQLGGCFHVSPTQSKLP